MKGFFDSPQAAAEFNFRSYGWVCQEKTGKSTGPTGTASALTVFTRMIERGAVMSKLIALLAGLILALTIVCVAQAAGPIPHVGQEEIKAGNEAAVDIDKAQKIITDPAIVERVEKIGKSLADIANTVQSDAGYGDQKVVQFNYSFKVIDNKDVNAFSLAGGHIYVYKGLLDFCESDHELAAVLAHEVAHAAHHHMVYLMREQAKVDSKMAVVLVAGLLGGVDGNDMSNVMMGTGFYKTAKVNGYSQEAERDADKTAFTYMLKAGYNPVGMLTFLERLADHPEVMELGIYRTHPASADRAAAVKESLVQLGIEINRRVVTKSYNAQVLQPNDDSKAYEVVVGDRIICKVGQEARAQGIADHLNSLLDQGIQFHDLKLAGNVILARNQPLFEVTGEDAGLAKQSSEQLAADSYNAVRRVIFKQAISQM